MQHGYFLNSTCDMAENKRQRIWVLVLFKLTCICNMGTLIHPEGGSCYLDICKLSRLVILLRFLAGDLYKEYSLISLQY